MTTYDVLPETDAISYVVDDASPYRCIECGEPLTYGGRGRKPKFCELHKRGSTSSTPKTSPSLKAAEESIAQLYTVLGMGLMMVRPTAAIHVVSNADKLAHSWIIAAETNPKLRKRVIAMAEKAGIGIVLIAHASVIGAILQDENILPSFGNHD